MNYGYNQVSVGYAVDNPILIFFFLKIVSLSTETIDTGELDKRLGDRFHEQSSICQWYTKLCFKVFFADSLQFTRLVSQLHKMKLHVVR
jgi:hypothetical protein